MTVIQLTRKIILRWKRIRFLILLCALILGAALYIYKALQPTTYSTFASIYPLTNTQPTLAASSLFNLPGTDAEGFTNISNEATLGIAELANSRSTREAVVATRILELQNRSIADLLLEAENNSKPFYAKKIKRPKTGNEKIVIGAKLLAKQLTAKTEKNGLFVITLTSTQPALLKPVTEEIIAKVSEFYKELKIKKATSDYEFTERKLDSLERVLARYDREAIRLNNSTYFVPQGKIEYTIPKENVISDKTRAMALYNSAASNREEALWRLQKINPIIAVLDNPNPPYDSEPPAKILFGIIGFFLGAILTALLFTIDLLLKYGKAEVNKMFTENVEVVEVKETVIINDDSVTTTTL